MKLIHSAKLLAATLVLGCSSLSAAMVQYTTNGIFSNTGTSTETSGGITLTLVGATGLVNANPTSFVGFGNLIVTVPGGSTTPVALPAGLTLTIQILQTLPTVGTGTLVGTLTGNLSGNSSTAVFTPSSATTQIGLITYAFTQNFYALVPPTSNSGDTSLQGSINAVPEAGTFSMLFGGILIAAGTSKRLRKRFV